MASLNAVSLVSTEHGRESLTYYSTGFFGLTYLTNLLVRCETPKF